MYKKDKDFFFFLLPKAAFTLSLERLHIWLNPDRLQCTCERGSAG